jgi:hypothetical protein
MRMKKIGSDLYTFRLVGSSRVVDELPIAIFEARD